MSSLLTGETASNNNNVAKIFPGENPNKEASGQLQNDYKPPTKIMPPPTLKVRQVPMFIKMFDFSRGGLVDTQIGTRPEYYWE